MKWLIFLERGDETKEAGLLVDRMSGVCVGVCVRARARVCVCVNSSLWKLKIEERYVRWLTSFESACLAEWSLTHFKDQTLSS